MLTNRRIAAAVAIFTGVLFVCIEAHAQSLPKETPSRTELYAIPSLTLSDQQFLAGDANGEPVTVAGELRIAQGTGRLPVVIMMHGSGGIGLNIEPWVHHFNYYLCMHEKVRSQRRPLADQRDLRRLGAA